MGCTLGPAGRPVAIERSGRRQKAPELLDDAGTVARRITGVPDRFVNMGLMLGRHVAWRGRSEVGDGSATAAVICASTHRALTRYVAAGADPNALRRGVERAVDLAVQAISAMSSPIRPGDAERFAAAFSNDPAVAPAVAEAVTVLGQDAVIVVRESMADNVHLEFTDGALWESGLASPEFIIEPTRREVVLARPHVLIWDAALENDQELIVALGRLRESGVRSLVVVGQSTGAKALAVLLRNNGPDFQLAAVNSPLKGTNQAWAIEDIAVLTGGRVLSPDRGDRLSRIDLATVGKARRVTAGRLFFNIQAYDDTSAAVARQIASVRELLRRSEDENERESLLSRLGRLSGGMGTIWVGARTETERALRRRSAERALANLRAALVGGVVPGGGASYLAAARRLPHGRVSAEDLGVLAVAEALDAPTRWIACNAGLDPSYAVARGRRLAPGKGIDVLSGDVVDLVARGIVDPTPVAVCALSTGATAAATAATCHVLAMRPDLDLFQADLKP